MKAEGSYVLAVWDLCPLFPDGLEITRPEQREGKCETPMPAVLAKVTRCSHWTKGRTSCCRR